MTSILRRVVLCALVIVPLSACGDLPRPFEGAGRAGDPSLLEIRDSASVRVEIGDDMPEGASVHLARAMAKALRMRDIPAYSDHQKGGDYILHPNVDARLAADGAVLDVTWVLMTPDRLAIDTARSTGHVDANDWFVDVPTGPEEDNIAVPRDMVDKVRTLQGHTPDPVEQRYDQLVAEPADRIAFLISGDRSALRAAPVMKVALIDFAGAPGDGNNALARSAGAFLQSKGITVDNTEIDDRSVVLSATINVSPLERETPTPLDRVVIEWVIMDADGNELGQMKQNNVVPRGRVDQRWGTVASLAAQAAVDALEGALGQIAESRKMRLRADKKRSAMR